MPDPAARGSYRAALSSGEFRALFTAYTVSLLGSVVSTVALTVLVYERTGSPFLSSLAFALGFLPYVISGVLLSAVVDRVPPRLLLGGSDALCAVLAGLMALPGVPIAVLLALLFLVSTLTSMSSGARGGLVRTIVGDAAFVPARSLLRISAQSAQILGNGVGGLLLVAFAPRSLLIVNAASFALSALVTRGFLQRRPAGSPDARGTLLRDSLGGVARILRDRRLRAVLLLGWLLPPFSVAPESLAAPYVLDAGASRGLVGWWLVALPVGVIVGDLLGVWLLDGRRQQRLVKPIAAVQFLPYLVFLTHPPVAVAIPLLVVAGLGAAYFLGLDGILRDLTPPDLFARLMAVNTAGLISIQGLGFAAAGALAQVMSPALVIALAGACGLVTLVVLPLPRPEHG